jgi:hypothetical protein
MLKMLKMLKKKKTMGLEFDAFFPSLRRRRRKKEER